MNFKSYLAKVLNESTKSLSDMTVEELRDEYRKAYGSGSDDKEIEAEMKKRGLKKAKITQHGQLGGRYKSHGSIESWFTADELESQKKNAEKRGESIDIKFLNESVQGYKSER